MKKPKTIITTDSFRIVVQPSGCVGVEKRDGCDSMWKQRWRAFSVGEDSYAPGRFRDFASEVAHALIRRAKRRARKGSGK